MTRLFEIIADFQLPGETRTKGLYAISCELIVDSSEVITDVIVLISFIVPTINLNIYKNLTSAWIMYNNFVPSIT